MHYSKLVHIENELLHTPDIETLALNRTPYVQQLVNDFTTFYKEKYGIEISSIPDIAESISYLYFILCYEHIKPAIEDKTNKFKMASLMELIIVQKQVLIHPSHDGIQTRELNALFGMTAALSMINCMINNAGQEFFCNTLNAAVNERVQALLDDHQLWLQTKYINDLPIFINAQFYEFIELIHTIPVQIKGF